MARLSKTKAQDMCAPGWLPERFNARQPVTRTLLGSGSDRTCFDLCEDRERRIIDFESEFRPYLVQKVDARGRCRAFQM